MCLKFVGTISMARNEKQTWAARFDNELSLVNLEDTCLKEVSKLAHADIFT
jgi:hypothetical protein